MKNYQCSVPTVLKVSGRDFHVISFISIENKLPLIALARKNAFNSKICKAYDNVVVIALG